MKFPSTETLTQIIIGLGILIGLVLLGLVIVQRFRGDAVGRGNSTQELLTNFQEMRSRGDINDADYRRIKSVLGAEIHSELKDGKDKG
jgi:uncharacterized membrane protein